MTTTSLQHWQHSSCEARAAAVVSVRASDASVQKAAACRRTQPSLVVPKCGWCSGCTRGLELQLAHSALVAPASRHMSASRVPARLLEPKECLFSAATWLHAAFRPSKPCG